MQKLTKHISTLAFLGYSPLAPGTIASLAALPLYYLVRYNIFAHLALTAGLLVLGFQCATPAEKNFSVKDPPQIVIDEFSSMLLVYLFIPYSLQFMVAGFFLFRLFDILKIPHLKRLEDLPGGYGIMLDDIAAAILTNIILRIAAFTIR